MTKELYLGHELQVHRHRRREGPPESFVVLHYGSARTYSCREHLLEAHPIDELREWVFSA